MKKAYMRKFSDSPFMSDFFESFGLKIEDDTITPFEYINSLSESTLEDLGIDKENFFISLEAFISDYEKLIEEKAPAVETLTIVGGKNKNNIQENIDLLLKKGDIISIVGPTGSGKSRLLADIEWLANGDTPTGRRILINGKTPDLSLRYSPEHKLVAQLSQNMNFVMDLTAEEFILMHAESRLTPDPAEKTALIIEQANMLAGEKFLPETPVTSLSGGQSRALMIADTAFLSKSPIVLIDEIENAGIDRQKALELLVKEEKIVLMATHDPILALMGSKRIVIKNGGIHEVIDTTQEEIESLDYLRKLDRQLNEMRNILRSGGKLTDVCNINQ